MVKQIPLTRGLYTIVDDDIYEFLMQWKWYVGRSGKGKDYAVRKQRSTEYTHVSERKIVHMHSVIMPHDPCFQIDHIDGNGLNNRKENLRVVTPQQNTLNKRNNKRNTSGYKGVCWDKKRRKWRARIVLSRKEYNLGFFDDIHDAHNAYLQAAARYHGDFASDYTKKGN